MMKRILWAAAGIILLLVLLLDVLVESPPDGRVMTTEPHVHSIQPTARS